MLQSNRFENDLWDHLNDLLRKEERKPPRERGKMTDGKKGKRGKWGFGGLLWVNVMTTSSYVSICNKKNRSCPRGTLPCQID